MATHEVKLLKTQMETTAFTWRETIKRYEIQNKFRGSGKIEKSNVLEKHQDGVPFLGDKPLPSNIINTDEPEGPVELADTAKKMAGDQ